MPHTGGVSAHMQRVHTALYPNKPNPLVNDLTNMFTNAKSFESNVTFSVDGVDIPAHRSILMARSEYFKAMFGSGLSETTASSTTRLTVRETTREAFTSLLMYLYTGDADRVVNGGGVLELMDLAHRYGACDLEKYCLWYIESNVSDGTAIELLVWSSMRADMGLYVDLRSKVKAYILDHVESIMENHVDTFGLLDEDTKMELGLHVK